MTSTVGSHQKIKVLVVDDSAVIRTLITKLLAHDPLIEVVGSASDAFAARELLVRHNPDVMTLDVEMPRMDGLNFLEKVMQHFPTRTIIISSLTPKGSQLSQKALSMGAVDVISKSNLDVSRGLGLLSDELSNRIRAAASAKIVSRNQSKVVSANVRPGQENVFRPASGGGHGTVLCIAASTGGPEALRSLLTQLPANIPPTLIVQHMPAFFTKNFAESLTQVCAFPVREAVDGEPLSAGVALLAPGNFHMYLSKVAGRYLVRTNQEPALHGVRPAADPLFESVARIVGPGAIGVILTGMGRDGADGLLKMRQAGSYNIAQDEETSVVFGMPREAIDLGAVQIVSPLGRIPALIMAEIARRTVAKVG